GRGLSVFAQRAETTFAARPVAPLCGSSRAVGVVGFGAVSGFGSDPGLLAEVSGPGHVARRLGEGGEKRGAPGTVTSHAVIAALNAFNEYPLSPRNDTSINLESPLPSDAS
ncbi:MAG: hypothetical protein ACPIOQ_62120, partial [Promethearchaeia archaeon]